MSATSAMPNRNEVPEEQKWNLTSIFKNDDEWTKAFEEVKQGLADLEAFRGRFSEGPDMLLDFLEASEKIYRIAGKVGTYTYLDSATDSTNQAAQARVVQLMGLLAQLQAATAFAEPEMIQIGFDRIRAWMAESPDLEVYRHFFERLENKEGYVLTSEAEQVLALASDPLSATNTIFGQLTNADMKFKDALDLNGNSHEVGQSTIMAMLTDSDRELRRTAWENYSDSYTAFKNTIAATLLGSVKMDVFKVRARGYPSSLSASLSQNEIPTSVYHNLIDVFKKYLPLWHRYWKLRKQVLEYDELHWYDTVAPLSKQPPEVSFNQAVDWIAEGMQPLGGEYGHIMRNGCLEERWVDWAINKGKRAGAFSGGSYDTHPFIMMSWSDSLFSLSTLAHELGHSMHSYYARSAQPYIYGSYSLFVAEVASNFNQALTRAHLFETNSDRDFQLTLIDEAMSNYRRYFFIMPTLARFELEIHERVEKGEPVNADTMVGLCADLFEEGFGEHLAFDRERMGILWAQFGHLYRNFYVYQYATGISGANSLAYQVLTDSSGAAADRYLEFLKTGGAMYPIDALKKAGVDLESPEPVEQAFETLGEIVDRLEALI